MKNIKLITVLVFCAFSLSKCQNKEMEEKYYWLATPSAPQEYPMEVYRGALIADDFTYDFDAIWGTQNTGWGNNGGTMSVSTKSMEIPRTLEFTWLSLVENKVYSGKWKLDTEKIAQLFKEGFIDKDTNKKETYDEFRIGLAPKGRVVLWIQGSNYQKEVGAFQAYDTIITADQAYESAKYMFSNNYAEERIKSDFLNRPDVKERLSEKGYPNPDVYSEYRKKYPWKLNINLPEGYNLERGVYVLSNGEMQPFDKAYSNEEEKAIPYYISMLIKDGEGKEYGADIIFTQNSDYRKNYILSGDGAVMPTDFDLNEVNSIFRDRLNSNPIDFNIDIKPKENVINIKLIQEKNVYPLINNQRLIF